MNAENGRIVRNTGLLYFRLIFLTAINFYTVRVTLEALGKIDYGIYEVIASLVASLSVLTGAMTSASQRYLSFHLGQKNLEKYSSTFTLLLMCFIVIALFLILIGEVIGCFFIDEWLNIPADKRSSSYWVFQASLLSFGVALITIPYTSSIIANERMDAFAIFSVIEGILKLGVAFWLIKYGGNRLILYGALIASITLAVFFMSVLYCHSRFKYCRYIWKWDRDVFTELSKYTGWNLFGSVSAILATAGQNILLNIFFGPIINTSKGIADKIQHVINGFSTNLYLAVSPQIIKSYASSAHQRAMSLVLRSSKLSFILIFLLAYPLICNMDGLLRLWLGPESMGPDMVAFSKLILVYCMIFTLESPITRIIQATGSIHRYQLSVGIVTLSYIPIAAAVLYLHGSAVMTLVTLMVIMALAQCVRIYVAHQQVGLDYPTYFKMVLLPIFKIAFVAVPIYWVFEHYSPDSQWLPVIIHTLIAGIVGITMVTIIGLDKSDRTLINSLLKAKFRKH